MMHVLAPDAYSAARNLFQPEPAYVFCAAVLAGKERGKVVVDDLQNPSCAFVLARQVWGFLSGEPKHAFLQELNQTLFAGKIIEEHAFGLLLTCETKAWHQHIEVLCKPRLPLQIERWRFIAHPGMPLPMETIAAGYELRAVDPALLALGISFPEDVTNLLLKRKHKDQPQEQGFGYLALKDETWAAYTVIDCIVGDRGDLGLVTQAGHRCQGLATATACATLQLAFDLGLQNVHWDCDADNPGSVRTAQKLGLQKIDVDVMFVFAFDSQTHARMLAT